MTAPRLRQQGRVARGRAGALAYAAGMDVRGAVRRGGLLTASGVGLACAAVLVGLLPVPYVSLSPGAVRDTLGEHDGKPLLSISGRPVHPTSGALDLTTVSVSGGPGAELTVPDLLLAWVDPDTSLVRREQLYAEDETPQQAQEEGEAEMTGSQEAAKVAALRELGIEVPAGLTIASAPGGEGGLRAGDVVTAVDGTPVADVADLRARVREAGAGAELAVAVRRDGGEQEVRVEVQEGPDGAPRLGVVLSPFVLPFRIDFTLADVIGPSAGLMFSLAVVDELTPGAMTGGEHVAGTGSISADGEVGVIGGLRQKLIGARDAGAEWFLAPAPECAEVRGAVPDGLRLVPVTTLRGAREAVEAIGRGDTADLPSCPA